MINFIKDAVTAVSGIKSFLFNTDYRNNFDLQNVEFPCCVLTPIMNKKYDLNNIIRESAELQLSIVESAPYDYTGDDLYAINKRCSDLALQVISNLQVKSKLDKELTFEFILPSGDEFISGVMCNLQCTMKQGSCIGAPSYIEIVVQPIKRESITSNGKHIITPSSGFNAMREVEVDVNIGELTTEEKVVDITSNGEVEILPTKADAMTKVTANVQVPPPPLEEKQVTITKAKTTEIITPDAEYGLNRVEVSTDIPLESKQVTITENGTTTIEASEGFEGIERVEVATDVNTLQGLDFSEIYDAEQADELNAYFKKGIENQDLFAKSPTSPYLYRYFTDRYNLLFVDTSIILFPTNIQQTYMYCVSLRRCPPMDLINVTSMIMNQTYAYCYNLDNVEIRNMQIINNIINPFMGMYSLVTLKIYGWRQSNMLIQQSSKLSPSSIHHIIQNAVDLEDGATARTLTLHATAKTNWQNSEYYEQDLAVLSTKGITIA